MSTGLIIAAAAVVSFASFLTSLGVIITWVKKYLKMLDDKIRVIVREEAEGIIEQRDKQNDRVESLRREATEERFKVIHEILNTKIKDQEGLNSILKKSLVETWKEEFRQAHYYLRETGIITDNDKAYLDKIYHHYKDLGGNSDVDAKYLEMCNVYESRTQERYDKAYEKYKAQIKAEKLKEKETKQ